MTLPEPVLSPLWEVCARLDEFGQEPAVEEAADLCVNGPAPGAFHGPTPSSGPRPVVHGEQLRSPQLDL